MEENEIANAEWLREMNQHLKRDLEIRYSRPLKLKDIVWHTGMPNKSPFYQKYLIP